MSNFDLVADFKRAVAAYGGNTAVWASDRELTYNQLDQESSALATWMQSTRKSADGLLGIMLPKSTEAVISIIAALKAEMPYAPIDPSWPSPRRTSIFEQSGFDILVTRKRMAQFAQGSTRVISPDGDEWDNVVRPAETSHRLASSAGDKDLAYILFTSGSTGDPKGVCVSRRAAHYFPDWARNEFQIQPADRIASLAPFTFDLSTFDLFSTLCAGAAVYLVPETTKMLPSSLSKFLQDQRITTIYAVPSNLGLLSSRGLLEKRDLGALRTVLFAGEVFPLPLYREFAAKLPKEIRYCNLYGPTETNVCTYFDTSELTETDAAMPIGRALPGTSLFIERDNDTDSEGELCAIGPAVMSGYWGHGADGNYWTTDENGDRAYRTGDQASQRDDGNWLYFGRKDNMVKVWGYRVELGEIESCLLGIDGIEQAAVVKVSRDGAFGDSLVAFVAAAATIKEDARGILKICKSNLPPYMCPQQVHFLESVPLSHNGKIDRRKLLAIAEQ
ncbi:MAG: amino acid adenylation domain-containing protein [Gammaproteobacteria bacterium]|nr:amino acid adenylation domain-containing protein [Gammaproteobacteria bacterium]